MTLFAHFARGGGSLAALAAALVLAVPATPAAAQDMPAFQPDDPAPAPSPPPPSYRPTRTESSGGPARAEIYRSEPAPAPRFERPDRPERPAPRFERTAEPQAAPPPPVFARQAPAYSPPTRIDPDVEARAALGQRSDDRRGRRGGFGDVITRAETVQREQQDARRVAPTAQQIDRRSEQRADRVDRRSEQRADQIDRRSEQRADRVEQRGDVRADRLDWRGRDAAADRVDRRTDIRGDRIEDRGDRRADRVEDRGDRRADRIEDRGDRRADGRVGERRDQSWGGGIRDIAREGRRDEWRDGRGGGDDRRDQWRDGRRGDWRADRRDWRRDDWRWGWNGRPGWDNRDFRRWDNRWRDNRSYNWNSYRRTHRVIYQPGPYFAPYRNHRYDRLSIGFYLDSLFFQPRFFINDPWAYRLPPAYGPYQWVRYYDDVLLVDIYSGEVVDVIHDFFW